MSCYNPILALPDYDYGLSDTGNFRYKLYGHYDPGYHDLYSDAIKIPCGKCLGCRLDYSRSWADRMILELDSYDGKGIFVTLTYNEDHVPTVPACDQAGEVLDYPLGYTLEKRDVQLFFKRLRKHFADVCIRYYSCGEYGKNTHRPHYHAIIFGLGLDSFHDLVQLGKNELGQFYYTSKEFEDIWQNGFVVISEVSYKTCAYVSRYVMKKAFCSFVDEYQAPEFVLMSRRPGIGSDYLSKHPDCVRKSHIYLSDPNGSVKVSIPRYFMNKLKISDPDLYKEISSDRIRFSRDRDLLKLQNTSLSYIEQLELDQNRLFNKTQILFNLRE